MRNWLLFFIFVFLCDCVTGLMQGHPLMPIIIIKALYIHLSDELLSNWLVDETYWFSSLPFWNMSGTTWSRFDFAQCFSILPSLKVYKQFHLFVFEEVLFLFFNPRLPCDFHYLEVNYNFYYIFKRYCSSYLKTCFIY